MKANRIELSDDGMELKIHGPGGQVVTARSGRTGGFIDADLKYARSYQFRPSLERGQVNTAWRFRVGEKFVYIHKGTGPPTWWLPRLHVRRSEIMVGWLRLMVAVAIKSDSTT